jgi:hypothetical protein
VCFRTDSVLERKICYLAGNLSLNHSLVTILAEMLRTEETVIVPCMFISLSQFAKFSCQDCNYAILFVTFKIEMQCPCD